MRQYRVWIGRILIFVVIFFNVQCALAFLMSPQAFMGGFELEGSAGENVVRGFGILFLMWNVPYLAALSDPIARRFSLYEAIVMQAIGLTGESLLLAGLPPGHPLMAASIVRFIIFDGIGLVFLLAALAVTARR